MLRMQRVCLAALCAFALSVASANAATILRCGLEVSRSNPQFIAAEKFAQLVKEGTGGAIEIRNFPDNTIGNATALLAGVRSGTVDIILIGNVMYTGLIADLGVLDLPFLFRDYEHVDKTLDGEVGRSLMKILDNYEMVGLAFWEVGMRQITNSVRQIRKPEDVAGLKIRTAPNPYHMEAFRILGANPLAMPYSEVYTALETKSVDAQEQPLSVTYSGKFFEVQKYESFTRHAYTAIMMSMNKARFESLKPEHQKVIREAALEAGKYERQLVRQEERDILKKIRETGVDVEENPDSAAFKAKIRDQVYKKFVAEMGDKYLTAIENMK